jgi:hypothetical protein
VVNCEPQISKISQLTIQSGTTGQVSALASRMLGENRNSNVDHLL